MDAERIEVEQHILRQLHRLNAIHPSFKLTDRAIDEYMAVLEDLDPYDIEAAVQHIISSPSPYYPKPGEIREVIFDLRTRADGAPTPYEAWGQVIEALYAGAGHPIVGYEHENGDKAKDFGVHENVLQAVQYLGGWRAFYDSENTTADRARFVDAYREVARRATEDQRMLPQVRQHIKSLADSMSASRQLEAPSNREEQDGN